MAPAQQPTESSRGRSRLPFGSEFSPSQIDLRDLLEMVDAHEGDQPALQQAILGRWFAQHGAGADSAKAEKNRNTLAMNCRLGLRAYGIIDTAANFTAFGREMYALRADEKALYDALAKHILLNLRGMALIQCIRDMAAAGDEVNLTSLRSQLAERGVDYPSGGKHPTPSGPWPL